MIIPCQIHVISKFTDVRQLYAVYTCADTNGVIQYVGVSLLSKLFTLEDAYNNSEFSRIFADIYSSIEIKCVSLTTIEGEALAEARNLIRTHAPHCNLRGFYQRPEYQSVVCDQTGEIFHSVRACATAHGLSASALSNHLNRKPGYKTVKGKTYRRQIVNIR